MIGDISHHSLTCTVEFLLPVRIVSNYLTLRSGEGMVSATFALDMRLSSSAMNLTDVFEGKNQ